MTEKITFEKECEKLKDRQRSMLELAKVLASFNDKEIFTFMNLLKRFDHSNSDTGYERDLQKFKEDLIKIYWKSRSDTEDYIIANNYDLKAYRLWNIYDILVKSEYMEPLGLMSTAYAQIYWFCLSTAFREMNEKIGSNIDIEHIYKSE